MSSSILSNSSLTWYAFLSIGVGFIVYARFLCLACSFRLKFQFTPILSCETKRERLFLSFYKEPKIAAFGATLALLIEFTTCTLIWPKKLWKSSSQKQTPCLDLFRGLKNFACAICYPMLMAFLIFSIEQQSLYFSWRIISLWTVVGSPFSEVRIPAFQRALQKSLVLIILN